MKIEIKSRKKFFQRLVLPCIGAVGLVSLGIGIYTQNRPKDLRATSNLIQKLNDNGEQKEALVFFKDGCPYCRAGKSKIESEAQKAKFPVYYVDTQSDIGKLLVKSFKVKYASTITVVEKGKYKNIAYADKINGKIIPLSDNIKKVFEGS